MTHETLAVPPTPIDAVMMATPAPQMQVVLDQLTALGSKPLHMLTVETARVQATPTGAVAVVMAALHFGPGPTAAVVTRDFVIPGSAGEIEARFYSAKDRAVSDYRLLPRGGWVIADIDTYDASARALSLGANAVVFLADYRQAPEGIFPAAHVDACAVYFRNLGLLRSDPAETAFWHDG